MSELELNNPMAVWLRNRYDDDGSLTEELHKKYGPWLNHMGKRQGAELVPLNYDPSRREQSMFVPKIEAHDSYPWAPDFIYYRSVRKKLVRALGSRSYYSKLSTQLANQRASDEDPRTLLQMSSDDRQEGQNILINSSHSSFEELGIFNALRFIEGRDRPNIDKRGVLLSKIMARQSFHGTPVPDLFRPLANVYFSSPLSASAVEFGIPETATTIINSLGLQAMDEDLAKGGLELDAALTGKQIVPRPKEVGGTDIDHLEIPTIAPGSADFIKRFHKIITVTMIGAPYIGEWRMAIDQVIDVQQRLKTNTPAEIVDSMYWKIAGHIEDFTGIEVDYLGVAEKLGGLAVRQGRN